MLLRPYFLCFLAVIQWCGLIAVANPLAGMKDAAKRSVEKQGSPGLGLVGFDFDHPSFSRDEEKKYVNYDETPDLDKQKVIKDQSSPAARATSVRNHADSWRIGDGWLGASFAYHAQGDREGNAKANAQLSATVLGKSTSLASATVTTERRYFPGGANTDQIKYLINAKVFGQSTYLEQGSVTVGQRMEGDDKTIDQQFFKQFWDVTVGFIPVRIHVALAGKVGTGKPGATFGLAANTLEEVSFDSWTRPWGGLTAEAGGELFGQVPAEVRPGGARAVAQVTVINGQLLARSHGSSHAEGACLDVKLGQLTTMRGRLFAQAWWNTLQVSYVTDFVESICDNGWVTIPGCSTVTEYIRRIENWLNFNYEKTLLRMPGFRFSNEQVWLAGNACRQPAPRTTLRLVNNTDKKLFAFYGKTNKATGNWSSHGWYGIEPWSSHDINLGVYQGGVLVHAQYAQGATTWASSNGSKFCAHKSQAFTLDDANNPANCVGNNHAMMPTSAQAVEYGQTATFTFNPEDREDIVVCNQRESSIYAAIGVNPDVGNVVATGWYEVPTNECKTLGYGRPNQFYLYAEQNGQDITHANPSVNLCVDRNNRFEIPAEPIEGCRPGHEKAPFVQLTHARTNFL